MTKIRRTISLFVVPFLIPIASQIVRADDNVESLTVSDPGTSALFQKSLTRIAGDQKRIWSFPAKLLDPKVAIPAAAVVATTAALIAVDPAISAYFRSSTSSTGFNRALSGNITGYGTLATPAALLAAGLLRRDPKMTAIALEAGEAIASAEMLAIVMKDVTRRESPSAAQQGWFSAPGTPLRGNGSFPSGHTISAFALATVISRRYSGHRWVPWVAYGLAGAVGFSRVSGSAHFASDVFLGAALGYSVGRFAVLRQ